MMCLLSLLALLLAWACVGLVAAGVALRLWCSVRRARLRGRTVAFFHPYCNAGGGGERVLWCAIAALLQEHEDVECVVYTGDVDASPAGICQTAHQRFGVEIDSERTKFVYLRTRWLVEASLYPHFTMLLQSLGSVVLGMEAMFRFCPHIMIDSMGYAFVLPLFRFLAGCPVGAYVHYPTISTDMLTKVKQRQADFNNDSAVARSSVLSNVKLAYYRMFAGLYGLAGSCSAVTLVNSSWTRAHIDHIWRVKNLHIVFPPCDTQALLKLPLAPRQPVVLSVAQFRPEKNHKLQVQAFHRLLSTNPQLKGTAKLIMVGGCRNTGDERRVEELKALVNELGLKLDQDVCIETNVEYSRLKELLSKASTGLHTMRDEHFGIGVVEFLAAGVVAVAHNSAGPAMDIVVQYHEQQTGFLATTETEYAESLYTALTLSDNARQRIQQAARLSVQNRFSEEAFSRAFVKHVDPLLLAVSS